MVKILCLLIYNKVQDANRIWENPVKLYIATFAKPQNLKDSLFKEESMLLAIYFPDITNGVFLISGTDIDSDFSSVDE